MSVELAVAGADISNMQAGGGSLFDNTMMFTGSAVLSGLGSIYNTFVDYGSKIGIDAEQIDTGRVLENYDQNWYNFYRANQSAIDVTGFVASSFIPGTLAIKGLKAAQAARATGAIGRSVTGSLNYFNRKRDIATAAGLQELATEGGSAFAYINTNKLAAIGWGFAEQALQAGAFEAAVALTMTKSPVLADKSSGEILSDMGMGMLVGGAFGGAIDGIITNKIFKDAVSKIGLKQREYDVQGLYANRGLGIGDEVYGMTDSLLSLRRDVAADDTIVNVFSPLSKKNIPLNIENLLKNRINATEKAILEKVNFSLKNLGTELTPEVGDSANKMLLRIIDEGRKSGASDDQIKQSVGNYFLGNKSWRVLTDERAAKDFAREDIFYLAHEVDLSQLKNGGTVEELFDLARNRRPFDKVATAKPYEVTGDVANAKVTATARTFEEAWAGGNDMAIIGGKVRINPKSEIFRQVQDPVLLPSRFINSRTMGVSDDVVPTWADLLPAGTKATDKGIILENGVMDGKRFKLLDDVSPDDVVHATARHAWAGTRDKSFFAGRTIDDNDISLLDRVSKFTKDEITSLELKVRARDGGTSELTHSDIAGILSDAKLTKMQDLLDSGVTDMRHIAYVINAPESFLERAIANGFSRTAEDTMMDGMSHELSTYLARENFLSTWASPKSLVSIGALDEQVLKDTAAAAASKGATYVDTFVTGHIGFMHRVEAAQKAADNATAAAFGGEEMNRFLNITDQNLEKYATELGVGAGLLSSSNAGYGDKLKLWAQYTGQLVHNLIAKTVEKNALKLQPWIATFQDDPRAGAELGVILTKLRRSPDKFVIAFDSTANNLERLVVRDATRIDKATGQRVVNPEKMDEWIKKNSVPGLPQPVGAFTIENQKVMDFLKVWKDINGERINKRATLMNARGGVLGWDPEVIYAPPIDTETYKYMSFVKIKAGHIAGGSDVGMITARTEEELSKLVRSVDTEKYDVIPKTDVENYKRAKNEYDASLVLNEPRVDSNLRREGKLGDFFYEVRPESVMQDFIQHAQRADAALVRHGIETKYGQLITELRALGEEYTKIGKSQFAGITKVYDKSSVNPFEDYVRTALDVSKKSEFPFVHQLNEFVDRTGIAAYRALSTGFASASKNMVSWQEAERLASRYGIGGVYNADNIETAFKVANRPMDRNLIRETVSKVNMAIATLGLRLDVANSIVNTISMPIMLGTELASLKSLAKRDPEALGALNKVFNIDPADGLSVPSYTKVIGNAISNILGKDGKNLIESYRKTGEVKDIMLQFHEMMGELAIKPTLAPKSWRAAVDSAVEKGAKWTGNNFAEDFTRAVSANVMDQLTAPLVAKNLLTSQEAAAYRSVFVNRVNGNYITSQRPIMFQGTVGAAVSLFQTYVFNIMQQMTRHIENRDMRALLTMGGLQGALYGFNGMPFFEAVNTHIIGNASINDGHKDVYSLATQTFGKELGDWMMYGSVSALPLFGDKMPALYTRGDINPRHISILPVTPADIPAVSVTLRFAQNLKDIGGKLISGADISRSLLEGLEHNGVSRPLAGLAQIANQYTTTSKGSLISGSNEFDLTVAATRALGAKPVDEAIALNTMYRLQAYKAADLDRLSRLGEVVKTKLRKNEMPTDDELQMFMKKYASAGGNLQNYSQAIQRWSRNANVSVVNEMKNFHNSSYSQRLAEIMGDTTLDDFTGYAAQEAAQQQPLPPPNQPAQ
jgi:hypothetical protein